MSRYTQGECPHCGSSDAYTQYEDGVAHCFSCNKSEKVKEEMNVVLPKSSVPINANTGSLDTINGLGSYPISSRNISKEVVEHFGVKLCTETRSHYYPYTKKGNVVAYKERKEPKAFVTHGDFKNTELFGQAVATRSKMLVITEGELDALAVSQAYKDKYNKYYPVVSIPSASGTKSILEQREWINQYETVILLFDNDEAGQKAVETAAKIIGAGKVKIGQLREKDPCDEYIKNGADTLINAIWNARTWSPAGIVMGEAIWDQFKARQDIESIPYPSCLNGLNEKLKGIRHGEITLFTSGTGSGKSTVIKEIILDLLDKTDDKVGLISLEESVGDTAEKFISMALSRSILGDNSISEEELRNGFDKVFSDERLILLDHQGSVGDSSLIDKIEYMALCGCKYLVLDHITIAVSEGSEGLSGNEAVDKIMSDLLKVVKKHNVWLGLISHLRKASGGTSFEEGKIASIDDIKGSGSIKQISFDIIAFARNLQAEDETQRNTIEFSVLKSRFTGLTGKAGKAIYDNNTARLLAVDKEFTSIG